MASLVLEPGADIRPNITHEDVKLLVERLYGICTLELAELNGYDDKNYKILEDPNVKNPLITNHSEHGYVLKVMNSMDSQNKALVEAQNEIMNYLHTRNITCPKPIRNVFGHQYSVETLGSKQHVVRLLEYVPGELLKDVPITKQLMYQLGTFLANVDNKLEVPFCLSIYRKYLFKAEVRKNFDHSGLVDREHIWMLSKVPELEKFKYVIKDAEKLDLVEEVIEEFKYAIVPHMEECQKGVIHGDFNEMNVLVTKKPGTEDYQISGLLDFGDIQHSAYIFELAVACTYMLLVTADLTSPAYVLAGYCVNRRLPQHEYRMLKTLISSRLVQSLTLGAYTSSLDPNNTYVTSTEKANGWELLRRLRKSPVSPEGVDLTNWREIADEYLTKS